MKKLPTKPYIWYRRNPEYMWEERACFAFLRDGETGKLYARFQNNLDQAETTISTKEWFGIVEDLNLMDWVEEYSIEKDYYYVTVPLEGRTRAELLLLFAVLRYPGEAFNICWNYQKINALCPKLKPLEKLYLAHQYKFPSYPYNFSFNSNHAVFMSTAEKDLKNLRHDYKENKQISVFNKVLLSRSFGDILSITEEEFKELYNV